jgi:hypothetical protein
MDAYLTVEDARTLAQTLGVTLVADDAALAALLIVATLDIDTAMRYQGRKYDPDGTITGTVQTLEFPRVDGVAGFCEGLGMRGQGIGSTVYDWDVTAAGGGAAVVPAAVKTACVYQAAYLGESTTAEAQARLERIRSGLASQKIATAEEVYLKPAEFAALGGLLPLCERARRLMERYRLRSGALL